MTATISALESAFENLKRLNGMERKEAEITVLYCIAAALISIAESLKALEKK